MENQNPNTNPSNAGKGLGIASLVLGILAFIFSFVPCLGAYAFYPGVVGVILGIVSIIQANKAQAAKGLAIAGLALSLVGTAVAVYQYQQLMKATKGFEDLGSQMKQSLDSLSKANTMKIDSIAQDSIK